MSHGTPCHGTAAIGQQRKALIGDLFPAGVPRLWCPSLTHFRARGELDETRIRRHLHFLAPYVKGLLVPGSTGEGWEMNDDDIRRLLEVVLQAARPAGMRVLIGVLKHTLTEMLQCADTTVTWLAARADGKSPQDALVQSGAVGFTVCPPRGRTFSQTDIEGALSCILERGLPTALYQLPQVTDNEMSPETVASLASRYPNFYLFKDTSGGDRVAVSGLDLGGVFLVRGAEGGYARWTRAGSGPYDGLLLSTANVFAPQLHAVLELLARGRSGEAAELSRRVETVVQQTFALVADFPVGNAFTNANKLLDHIMAHGSAAQEYEPPLLRGGTRLPAEFVERAATFLRGAGLFPDAGYCSLA
ncbi:MAG: dihydrodipicolinate synthase family protein [Planctomycetes bacterium]|nr:dihydrodipicolinate synthase family protein [Planctomycetota bacterium]